MELTEAYREVELRLNRIDFSALWPGFAPLGFALYDETRCCMGGETRPRPETFYANTTVPYGGEQIAIWELTEKAPDLDRLTASMVHEMFHAFQVLSGESRWADETEALMRYRYQPEGMTLKLREAELMEAILERGETSAFPRLLRLRKRRQQEQPWEYGYEARIEQIEGTANLVELEALAQLDPEKGRAGWKRLLERLRDPGEYTPVRVISYAAGAVFLACVRRCSDFDFHPFSDIPFGEAILEGVEPAEGIAAADPAMAAQLLAYRRRTEEIVSAALAKGETALEGAYPLVSLNIYDARWDGRYAVSNFFVAYRDGEKTRTLEGDFVVELDGERLIRRVYRQ